MGYLHPIDTNSQYSYGSGDVVYEGTTPKYKIEIDIGTPMTEFNFEVRLIGVKGSTTITKAQMTTDEEDNYYLCFDTTTLGVGSVKAIVTALIPDPAFPNNTHKEIFVIESFLQIKKVPA